MSVLAEPPFEEAKARDPRYQRLFDCLDMFQCDLFDLFDRRVATRGFEAALSGQVSKISITHCSPNDLRISGTVKSSGSWVVSCLMSVAGEDDNDIELDLQCSCADDDRCEHASAILESFFDSAVAITLPEEGPQHVAYCSEDFETVSCAGGVTFSPDDGQLLIGLEVLSVRQATRWGGSGSFGKTIFTTRGDLLLKAVALGRCFLPNSRVPLELGATLAVQQGWRTTAKGYREAAILGIPDGAELLNAQPAPLYVNVKSGTVGTVVVDGAAVPVPVWVGLPRVKLEQSSSLLETLRSLGLSTLGLAQATTEGAAPSPAIPRVRVAAISATEYAHYVGVGASLGASDRPEIIRLGEDPSKVYAFRLSFLYGETEVTRLDSIMSISEPKSPGGQLLRNLAFERGAEQTLQQLGLKPFHTLPYARHSSPRGLLGIHSYDVDYYVALLHCVRELVVRAEAHGWHLDLPPELTPIEVQAFQAGEVRLFLMSLKAGGVGINLTRADTVILYDPWWNPAVEAQAICRAHRIGQSNPVFAYRLIAQGTIEEKIQELQIRKRALVENLLAENERPPELSEELVDFLFAPIDR